MRENVTLHNAEALSEVLATFFPGHAHAYVVQQLSDRYSAVRQELSTDMLLRHVTRQRSFFLQTTSSLSLTGRRISNIEHPPGYRSHFSHAGKPMDCFQVPKLLANTCNLAVLKALFSKLLRHRRNFKC